MLDLIEAAMELAIELEQFFRTVHDDCGRGEMTSDEIMVAQVRIADTLLEGNYEQLQRRLSILGQHPKDDLPQKIEKYKKYRGIEPKGKNARVQSERW